MAHDKYKYLGKKLIKAKVTCVTTYTTLLQSDTMSGLQ